MSGIDIAIIVVVVALFLSAVGYILYRKLRGKGGCDCGGSCATCGLCKAKQPEKSDESDNCSCCCCGTDGKKSE